MNEEIKIGGYFGLEKTLSTEDEKYDHLCRLVNGRSALYCYLKKKKPHNALLPFYCCDSLLEPFVKLKIKIKYYNIDEFFMPENINSDSFMLIINYFGILEKNILDYISINQKKDIIIDNTQGFYSNFENVAYFNSARKFFGVPEGSYLHSPDCEIPKMLKRSNNPSWQFLHERNKGNIQKGFLLYKKSEAKQPCAPINMSERTRSVLAKIDHRQVIFRRFRNFRLLHEHLGGYNQLKIKLESKCAPMCYPFLPPRPIMFSKLYEKNIFFPQFWPEVITRKTTSFNLEKKLALNMMPLPVDQRYDEYEMNKIIKEIKNLL